MARITDQNYIHSKSKKRKHSEETDGFVSNLKKQKWSHRSQHLDTDYVPASVSCSKIIDLNPHCDLTDTLDKRINPLQCDIDRSPFPGSSPEFGEDTDFARFVSSNDVDLVLSPRTWNCIDKEDYDSLMYRFEENWTHSSRSCTSVDGYSSSENKNSSDTSKNGHSTSERKNEGGSVRVGDVGSFPLIPDECYVALDCEMVGVGVKGSRSALARCSIVDYNGNVMYDRYIKPNEPITDYRTRWSGITPRHMLSADPIDKALQDVHRCIQNRIVIGHAVINDFRVIRKHPPCHMVRDTARCKLLVEMAGLEGQGNSLKKLAFSLLGKEIQSKRKGHDSVEDAITTLELYKLVRSKWEPELFKKWSKKGINVRQFLCLLDEHERNHYDEVDYLSDKYWPSDLLS